MPPAVSDGSDSESVVNNEPITTKEEPSDTRMKEEGDDNEAEGEEEEDLYVVEEIQDHRADFEDKQMRYHVKWKGYEKKADRTWETEENLSGAHEVLEAYWQSVGGKPSLKEPKEPKSAKKRGRSSTSGKDDQEATTKRSRTSKSARKSNGAIEQDIQPGGLIGFTEVGEDDWKPPPAKEGSWDPLVQSIDTVVRENSDGELWGYLIWNEKTDQGRFYRSKAKLPVIYKACPQRMLHFYENHLVFSPSGEEPNADDKTTA